MTTRIWYNGSQWTAICEYWAKVMGATYMRVRPICEDIWYMQISPRIVSWFLCHEGLEDRVWGVGDPLNSSYIYGTTYSSIGLSKFQTKSLPTNELQILLLTNLHSAVLHTQIWPKLWKLSLGKLYQTLLIQTKYRPVLSDYPSVAIQLVELAYLSILFIYPSADPGCQHYGSVRG